jgi:hypothetical protein
VVSWAARAGQPGRGFAVAARPFRAVCDKQRPLGKTAKPPLMPPSRHIITAAIEYASRGGIVFRCLALAGTTQLERQTPETRQRRNSEDKRREKNDRRDGRRGHCDLRNLR